MKKIILLLATMIIGLSHPIQVQAGFTLSQCDWNPYVGADLQWRYMSFKEGFGENTLEHSAPQGNGYAGIRLSDYVALEGGFEAAKTRNRIATLSAGEVAAGTVIGALMSPTVFRSEIKMQDIHVDLLGLYPIYDFNACPIEVFGSLGAAFVKATSERQTLAVAGIPRSLTRTLIVKKTVVRITTGLQYQLGNHLGIRGTVGWLNTAPLTIYSNDGIAGTFIPEVKPLDTFFCGIGLFWAF